MALGNTPRQETSIAVEANKSYTFGVWFKTVDGTPVDLTDSVLRFVATGNAYRTGAEILNIVATPMLEQPDMQQFEFQAEDLALKPGSYGYDVTLLPPSGYSIPILKGQLEVGSNADEDASNVYARTSTGTDITVELSGNDVVNVTLERVDGLFMLVQELLEDFRQQMIEFEAHMEALAAESAASAADAAASANELRHWMETVGFPFWKGTQAEYDAIPVKNPDVLYLIIA